MDITITDKGEFNFISGSEYMEFKNKKLLTEYPDGSGRICDVNFKTEELEFTTKTQIFLDDANRLRAEADLKQAEAEKASAIDAEVAKLTKP